MGRRFLRPALLLLPPTSPASLLLPAPATEDITKVELTHQVSEGTATASPSAEAAHIIEHFLEACAIKVEVDILAATEASPAEASSAEASSIEVPPSEASSSGSTPAKASAESLRFWIESLLKHVESILAILVVRILLLLVTQNVVGSLYLNETIIV